MTELPLVVIDVQRGGPSTGLPTKTNRRISSRQCMDGMVKLRWSFLAAQSPADCFYMAIEAVRIAVKYMTPVILLTDGYLASDPNLSGFLIIRICLKYR